MNRSAWIVRELNSIESYLKTAREHVEMGNLRSIIHQVAQMKEEVGFLFSELTTASMESDAALLAEEMEEEE